MAGAKNEKARRAVRTAQQRFEREQQQSREARRKAFATAQAEGMSLREIGAEAGLHHTRVGQIIRGT
ncbi:MAG TPA: hypothetical protein VFX45_10945 [Solirubrobacterales bacterium]|nr:hypothetical protein [Solirubrobacterales bacterium]